MGLDSFERDLNRKFAKYSEEANRAADQEQTSGAKAKAYAKVMKKHGVEVNVREMTKRFQQLMDE